MEKKQLKTEPTEEMDTDVVDTGELSYENLMRTLGYNEKCAFANAVAKPMASRKLAKKIFKLIKKSCVHKDYVRSGLRTMQKRIRRGETGIAVFAADITPLDVMCHMPGVCERKSIPYVYVPSRYDIGAALGVKRGNLMVLVREHADNKAEYSEIVEEIKKLPVQI